MSFVSGDTGSKLEVTCVDDDTDLVIDLTGQTARIKWLDSADALVTKVMTIVGAPVDGIAEYAFLANELIANQMKFEVELTDGTGKVTRNIELIRENVRPALS